MRLEEMSTADLMSSLHDLVTVRPLQEAVPHLVEVERRQLHIERGCASIAEFCTRVLHLHARDAKDLELETKLERAKALMQERDPNDASIDAASVLEAAVDLLIDTKIAERPVIRGRALTPRRRIR